VESSAADAGLVWARHGEHMAAVINDDELDRLHAYGLPYDEEEIPF